MSDDATAAASPALAAPLARAIAFVSRGRLYVKDGEGPAREIESKFGDAVREHSASLRPPASTRSTRASAPPSPPASHLLWGRADPDPASLRVAVAGLTRGRAPGELLYALQTNAASGVFSYQAETNEEGRVFHSADHRVHYLHARAGHDLVACSVFHESGAASIAVMPADGSDLTIVTEGDAVDVAPRWIPEQDRQLVYQSAGLARDAAGRRVALAPFSIQRLDLRKGELATLAEDADHDLLGPQMDREGALYYIRRPHRRPAQQSGILALLRTLILFVLAPLRYLLSRFTRARALRSEGASPLVIWGDLVDPAPPRAGERGEASAIVPLTWELCRQSPAGEIAILARGVVSFDLDLTTAPAPEAATRCPLVYTDGRAIYAVDARGATSRVFAADAIEEVALLG